MIVERTALTPFSFRSTLGFPIKTTLAHLVPTMRSGMQYALGFCSVSSSCCQVLGPGVMEVMGPERRRSYQTRRRNFKSRKKTSPKGRMHYDCRTCKSKTLTNPSSPPVTTTAPSPFPLPTTSTTPIPPLCTLMTFTPAFRPFSIFAPRLLRLRSDQTTISPSLVAVMACAIASGLVVVGRNVDVV